MGDEVEDLSIKKGFLFATYGEVLEFKALFEDVANPFDLKRTDSNGFTVSLLRNKCDIM